MSYLKCSTCLRVWTNLSINVCPISTCAGVCEIVDSTINISTTQLISISTQIPFDIEPDNESGFDHNPNTYSTEEEDQDEEKEVFTTVAEVGNHGLKNTKSQHTGFDAYFEQNSTDVLPTITNAAVIPTIPRSTKDKVSKGRSTTNRVKVTQEAVFSKLQNRAAPPEVKKAVPGYAPVNAEKPKKKKNKKKNKVATDAVPSKVTAQNGLTKFNVHLPLPEGLQPQSTAPKRPMNFAEVAKKPKDFSKTSNQAGGWTTVGNNGRDGMTGAWRTQNASSYLFSKPGGAFGRDPEDEVNEDFIKVGYGVNRSKYYVKRTVPRE